MCQYFHDISGVTMEETPINHIPLADDLVFMSETSATAIAWQPGTILPTMVFEPQYHENKSDDIQREVRGL